MKGFSQLVPGAQGPEITLPDQNGKQVRLSDLKGQIVLIDFWASWCGPCRKNNPHLQKIYKKYHTRGLEILGISLDKEEADWKQAVQQDRLDWVQVNDNRGWESSSTLAYGVDAIPASFLLDGNGTILNINMGGRDLEMALKKLLKK